MKFVRILFVLAFVLAAFAPMASASAVGLFTYTSSIQVQNLDNTTANISLIFYKPDGSIETTVPDTIPALGEKAYFPLPAGVGAGFSGSVVVTSTTNVASISNVHGGKGANQFYASGSYIAQNAGATSVGIPLLMKGNSGYTTWFNIQNAGTAPANVTVTYSDGGTPVTGTIEPGAAKTFDQNAETHSAKIFAASVTSSQPVVITAIEESAETLLAYNGFPGSGESTNPVIPLVHERNSGYTTNVAIQNRGSVDTTVTVTYYPAAAGTQCTEQITIPAGGTRDFAQFPFNGVAKPGTVTTCVTQRFVGAAQVTTNSANQPLVAVVNQWRGAINASAYSAFNPNNATSRIVLPLIFDRRGASQYQTSINLMNVGAGSTTVTCTYTNSSFTDSATVDANKGVVFFQVNKLGANYRGSATCTASGGGKIIAIVNEWDNSTVDDTLLTYEGISTP